MLSSQGGDFHGPMAILLAKGLSETTSLPSQRMGKVLESSYIPSSTNSTCGIAQGMLF